MRDLRFKYFLSEVPGLKLAPSEFSQSCSAFPYTEKRQYERNE
jgi:hypothetical protein